jgi:tetratricopeptide (TPR) repeat protein
MKMFRTIKCGLLGAFLLLGFVAPLTFTSCENSHPEINIEMKSDYSGIIDAINKTNTALADKLAVIESAIKEGTLKNAQALEAIKAAVASMEGTVAQKLAAIESAVKDQTTSFETKMALIETALNEGFADVAEGQDLMKQALESLEGTVAEKLAAVEKAVKDQTLSLETKLDLINTTVEEGFASIKEGQDLIVAALEAIDGTLQDKMDALEKAIKAQTTTLAAKLAAIEAAVKAGFADEVKALGLVKDAVKAVDGTLKTKLDALTAAVEDQTIALKTKLQLIREAITEGFANEAEALDLIEKAIKALPDYTDIFGDIKTALTNINYNLSANGAIVFQLASLNNALSGEGGTNESLAAIVAALVGDPDDATDGGIKGVLEEILEELAGTEDEAGISKALEDIAKALEAIQKALEGDDSPTPVPPAEEDDVPSTEPGPYTPENPSGTLKGQPYVEMGDGLKWATKNLGAQTFKDKGSFFAWGETTAKTEFSWDNYALMASDAADANHINKYQIQDDNHDGIWYLAQTGVGQEPWKFVGDGLSTLQSADDAANVNLGSTWRMPTASEWTALTDYNKFTWKKIYVEQDAELYAQYGPGYLVTSHVEGYEGNCIFIPYTSPNNSVGNYWTSQLSTKTENAKYYHTGYDYGPSMTSGVRYEGLSIRPVANAE